MKGRIYPKSENFVGSNGSTDAASKADAGAAVGQAIGEVAGVVIDAISKTRDLKLRRQFEQQLALLNEEEQKLLSRKMLSAQTDSDRRRILAENLSLTSIERIRAANKRTTNIVLYVVGGIIILASAFYAYKKFKK